MKPMTNGRSGRARGGVRTVAQWLAVGLALGLGAGAERAQAEVIVKTLGGGPIVIGGVPNGFVNGPTLQTSQFDAPSSCALDSHGMLFVADFNNGAVRKLDIQGDAATTFVSGIAKPVAVAIDSADNLYVADQGDGTATGGSIRVFDRFGNVGVTFVGLNNPTALTLDSSADMFVTEFGGAVKRITPAGDVTILADGFTQPRGIALMDGGAVAISDQHAIRLINATTHAVSVLAGNDTAGFVNGSGNLARFNHPYQIAKAPNGSLVVADRWNHAVRLVATNGVVDTLYGIATNYWASDYPGWEDGTVAFAEAHDPVGVTVANDGTVYTTELFYDLIRRVNGAALGAGGATNNPSDTNIVTVVIPPPTLSPVSGYFPMGQDITIGSAEPAVYYTRDGSEPTTNSFRLNFTNNVATLRWQETLRDLRSLRLKTFDGTNSSVTVGGVPSSVNEIGITRDLVAGIGSTVVVPVVINLRTNISVRSIQFRVEVTPDSAAVPAILDQFQTLSVSSNDFIRVVTSSGSGGPATFSSSAYSIGTTRGQVVSFIGTNANFNVQDFAVSAMLAVPIPATAHEGDTYHIKVLEASATTDGQQTALDPEPLPMPSRKITVQNVSYIVGDSAIAGWYNAGEFGNGDLKNNDVNTVFNASFGVRTPYPFTDLFNAMDVFPTDSAGSPGGDGQIRFLDWQTLLSRSLRLSTNNWRRAWADGGVRVTSGTSLPTTQNLARYASLSQATGPGAVWVREAVIGAGSFENISPGVTVNVPVYVDVAAGAALSGLQFRATVTPEGKAPALDQAVQFVPALGVKAPQMLSVGLGSGEVGCAWNIGEFNPPLTGSNVLGFLQFTVPVNAYAGGCYAISFSYLDGAPDLNTQYEFETRRSCVWVLGPAPALPDLISDQWKTNFFGSLTNVLADPLGDADGDGVPNWMEYLAGTNPTNALSRLQLLAPEWRTGAQHGLALRWLTAPGKAYLIESAPGPNGPWTAVTPSIAGSGQIHEVVDGDGSQKAQFYRVRLAP